MPYIKTRTNTQITNEQELNIKRRLGESIINLSKTESWLMVDFDPNCHLYFKGDSSQPNAYVEVKLFGKASAEAYNKMTNEITNILNEELSISPSNIYVSYFETDNWGWNGNNF